MNIARVVAGLGILSLFSACATRHADESAAPAASPSNADVVAAPAVEAAPGAPPPAAAPAPQGLDQPKSAESARDEEFTTLESAERALNQAKADLDRLALAEPTPTVGRSAADDAEKKDSKRGAPSAAGAAAPATATPNAQCDNACRAFASLSRAASAVCRLDGDSGSHCSHAKRVVSDSEHRVASCTCPAPGQ
jgi:hypothetical protein